MKIEKRNRLKQLRRWRIRKKVSGTRQRPRMSVRFTNEHIYVQFIDDAAGVTLAADASWLAPALTPPAVRVPRSDAYEATEKLVTTLLDLPGVPGHEWRVRNAIRASLPKWAADRAVVDSAGNLIVAVGPDKDSVGPTLYNGVAYFFNSTDEQKAAVWDFMKFVNTVESQVTWHIGTGYIPTRLSAAKNADVVKNWADRPGFKVAFDQLANHVLAISERLERLERSHSQDGLKDAVKALHQGLSRLADQINELRAGRAAEHLREQGARVDADGQVAQVLDQVDLCGDLGD